MELYRQKDKRSKVFNVTFISPEGSTCQCSIETVGGLIAAREVVSQLMKQEIKINPVKNDISRANVQVLDTSTGKLHYYFAALPRRNKHDKDFEVYLLDNNRNEVKVNVVAPGAASAVLDAVYKLNPTDKRKYTTRPVSPDMANAKVVNLSNNDVRYLFVKPVNGF